MPHAKKGLGVDFDDVIFHCDLALQDFHNARYGTNYTAGERDTFSLEHVWNCSNEEVRRRLDEFTESEFHERAPIVSGAKEALEKLNYRYDVVIVTGRVESARPATEKWLERNLLGLYTEIHFANHVYGMRTEAQRTKSEILQELGINVFVEDAPHFADEITAAGITLFLFDTPWNRAETPPGSIRVYSWEDVTARLLAEKDEE
jgi:uncharacterized HAD superfamily protein